MEPHPGRCLEANDQNLQELVKLSGKKDYAICVGQDAHFMAVEVEPPPGLLQLLGEGLRGQVEDD